MNFWLCDLLGSRDKLKSINSTTTVPMVTKFGSIAIKLNELFITWSCEFTWQTKSWYLHYHNAYCHQSCHGGPLPSGAPTHNVTWFFNYAVVWDHVTSFVCHICTCTTPMDTKHGKVTTYCEGLPPIKLQNPLNMWLREVTWQNKIIKSAIPQCLWSLNSNL